MVYYVFDVENDINLHEVLALGSKMAISSIPRSLAVFRIFAFQPLTEAIAPKPFSSGIEFLILHCTNSSAISVVRVVRNLSAESISNV